MMFWEPYIQTVTLKNLGISIAIFLVVLLLRKVFSKYVIVIAVKLTRKASAKYITRFLLAFEKPIQWFFVIVGIYVAAEYFPWIKQSNEFFINVLRAWIVVLIGVGLYNLTSATSELFMDINKRGKIKLDKILEPFVSQGLRFIIIALTFSIVVSVFGFNINGFVAGLGIGGLAFALAAQDAIANLFGGFVILTEKPFRLDDWIETPSVEGIVEDITFRSTRVRTFGQGLVTVPNATLSNEPITNWSAMGKREVSFNLTVTYDTPIQKIEKVVDRVDALLKANPEIHPETIFVAFNDYKENGAEIMLYYFTNTISWGEYLDVREAMNFEILRIIEEEDVSIAIPARRVFAQGVTVDNKNKE